MNPPKIEQRTKKNTALEIMKDFEKQSRCVAFWKQLTDLSFINWSIAERVEQYIINW